MFVPLWTSLIWSEWYKEENKQELEDLGLLGALGRGSYRKLNLNLLLRSHRGESLKPEEEDRLSFLVKRLTDVWASMTSEERKKLDKYLDQSKQYRPIKEPVFNIKPFAFPPSMKKAEQKGIVLHPYQRRAVLFALNHSKAVLGMEMGLGKTLIALTVAHILNAHNEEITRIIVVAPKSAHTSWKDHLEDFTETPFEVLSGWTEKARELKYRDLFAGVLPVVIVTPQTFCNDSNYFKAILSQHGNKTMLVLDEAHKAKSSNSLIGHTVNELSPLAIRVLGLTGTPQPNTVADLYYLVDRVKKGALGDISSFSSRFTYRELDHWDSYRGKSYKPGALRADRLGELHQLLKNVMLVISAKDPDVDLKLPPREDISPYIPLDDIQKEVLKSLKKATVEKEISAPSYFEALEGKRGLVDQIGAEGATANTSVLGVRIEQLAISPALFSDTFEEHYTGYESNKVKFIADSFMKFLQDGGLAGVIFCEHLKGLNVMKDSLIKRGLKETDILFYTGETKAKTRLKVVRSLNQGQVKVILGQTKALETGANLQERASFVAHLSTTWSPDTLSQSTARVYRQGQKRKVIVLRPSGSRLEEAKNLALSRKLIQSSSSTGLLSIADEAILKTTSDSRVRQAHRELYLKMGYNKRIINNLTSEDIKDG